MMKEITCLLTALLLSGAWQVALADTAWVGDRVMVDVFAEASADSDRVATLVSGNQIELLEGSEGNYVQIRTQGGVTGWIEAGFITMEAPAAQQLVTLQAERDELLERSETLETELEEAQDELATVRRQDGTRDQQLNQARNRAAAAERERQDYRSQAEEAEERIAVLESELESARLDDEAPETRVIFMPELEIATTAGDATADEPASRQVAPESALPGLPLLGLFLLVALCGGGVLGYRLRERQLRKRLGGLSL